MVSKQCFVPSCRLNSDIAPEKLFVTLPKDVGRRKLWFTAVNYDSGGFLQQVLCACEDHFECVVYILDKAVVILLATVLTGQALQLAGIMETPKGAGALEYQQQNLYADIMTDDSRWKRDTSSESTERSQLIDMLFNIPIKTLTVMNNLVQNSRPAFRKLREFALKKLEKIDRTTTKAPEITSVKGVQKRSHPVFVRETKEKLSQ